MVNCLLSMYVPDKDKRNKKEAGREEREGKRKEETLLRQYAVES